jgi:hypothetical protein
MVFIVCGMDITEESLFMNSMKELTIVKTFNEAEMAAYECMRCAVAAEHFGNALAKEDLPFLEEKFTRTVADQARRTGEVSDHGYNAMRHAERIDNHVRERLEYTYDY